MKLAYLSIISTSLLVGSVFTTNAAAEQTRPLSYSDSEMQLCGQAIDAQIKRQYGKNTSLVMSGDQLQAYFISNGGIEGVRGVGMVKGLANQQPQISFDCVVDTGNKQVQKAKITVLKNNTQDSSATSVPYDSAAGQACVDAIDRRIKGIYGRTTQLVYDANPFTITAQTSKSTTFSGNGMVKNLKKVPKVRFSCTVSKSSNRLIGTSLKITK
jgi:hypothetical protein